MGCARRFMSLRPLGQLDSYGSAGGPPGAGARGDMPSVTGQCPFDADDEACGLINRSLEVPPLDRWALFGLY